MRYTKFDDFPRNIKVLIVLEFIFFVAIFLGANQIYRLVAIDISLSPTVTATYIYAVIFALSIQLSLLSLGSYNPRSRENSRTRLRRILAAFAIGYFVCVLLSLLSDHSGVQPLLLGYASICGVVLTGCTRHLLIHYDLLGFGKKNVLVLGTGKRASIIEKRMRRTVDRQNFNILGFCKMAGDADEIKAENVIDLRGESLLSYARRNVIEEIVVACDERRGNLPTEDLFACKIRGINIIEILDFVERETGQVAVNLIYPSWVIYSNGFSSQNHLRNALDYLFNASMGAIVFLVALPFIVIAIVAIKIEDGIGAPVFYSQERVGLDGIPFFIHKFRSMGVDAEKGGAVWSSAHDSRITRVGAILRKYRIDELPQLYNVLKGDMGFVGPRPERPEFVKELATSIPYYNQRHNVKPGLTGWAQLKYPYGSSEEDARQKLHYDLYYIKHRSFLLDISILMRTAEVVLFGKGR
ncbi:MAG: TIGR03013 family XrtA/PEP-CTERM system glycosyltransferase [bacterium]